MFRLERGMNHWVACGRLGYRLVMGTWLLILDAWRNVHDIGTYSVFIAAVGDWTDLHALETYPLYAWIES